LTAYIASTPPAEFLNKWPDSEPAETVGIPRRARQGDADGCQRSARAIKELHPIVAGGIDFGLIAAAGTVAADQIKGLRAVRHPSRATDKIGAFAGVSGRTVVSRCSLASTCVSWQSRWR
jgi:hypothetical protein